MVKGTKSEKDDQVAQMTDMGLLCFTKYRYLISNRTEKNRKHLLFRLIKVHSIAPGKYA